MKSLDNRHIRNLLNMLKLCSIILEKPAIVNTDRILFLQFCNIFIRLKYGQGLFSPQAAETVVKQRYQKGADQKEEWAVFVVSHT